MPRICLIVFAFTLLTGCQSFVPVTFRFRDAETDAPIAGGHVVALKPANFGVVEGFWKREGTTRADGAVTLEIAEGSPVTMTLDREPIAWGVVAPLPDQAGAFPFVGIGLTEVRKASDREFEIQLKRDSPE